MNKKELSERDICTKFITPALTAGNKWDLMNQIREEVSFTKGRVIVRGQLSTRGEAKRADYLLSYKPGIRLAVGEAKDNNHSVGSGMQQGLEYGEILDVPYVFSSNGDAFLFHDRTGQSLARPYASYTSTDRVDVIITNPPFGGMEEDGTEKNFPGAYRTKETADLFLVLIVHLLRDGGRGASFCPTARSLAKASRPASSRNCSRSATCTPSSACPTASLLPIPASRPICCSSPKASRRRKSGITNTPIRRA